MHFVLDKNKTITYVNTFTDFGKNYLITSFDPIIYEELGSKLNILAIINFKVDFLD